MYNILGVRDVLELRQGLDFGCYKTKVTQTPIYDRRK